MKYRLGVVGGSGLYQMEGFEIHRELRVETPFGDPSDAYLLGEFGGHPVVFLSRHARGHRLLPSELNYRANIWGFKSLGVERLISVGAVGSLKIEYAPRHIVVPDQFFDRTRHRVDTFFGNGLVAHVSLADPLCGDLGETLAACGEEEGAIIHRGGTYLCMEGPQFSTRAESEVYRSWGMDVIGMTNLQEARLAREAEICYATLAMITDYDCWHEEEDDVNVESILDTIHHNVEMAQNVIRRALDRMGEREPSCACQRALDAALVTSMDIVPEETKKALGPIIQRFLPETAP